MKKAFVFFTLALLLCTMADQEGIRFWLWVAGFLGCWGVLWGMDRKKPTGAANTDGPKR